MRKIGVFVAMLAIVAIMAQAQGKDAPAMSSKGSAGLMVKEAKLGTDVKDKQLVGEATTFDLDQKVYVWLELSGGPAEDIAVTWKNGDKSYETKLKVGGNVFHTWASKRCIYRENGR